MSEFKRVTLGDEVRRAGTAFVGGVHGERRPIGIVVERFPHPEPKFPLIGDDAAKAQWHTQYSIAQGMPAQIKVYWQDTQQLEYLVEGEVIPNYPGDTTSYRAWHREFPLFAVETGGYNDVTILTPDGEKVVYVYGHHIPGFDELEDSEEQHRLLVRTAVERYLNHQGDLPAPEPAEQAADAS